MNESETFDLIQAYALGALSDEENRRVEDLLATSEEARRELRAAQELLVGMAALSPRRQAPARLTTEFKQRLAQSESNFATPPSTARVPASTASRLSPVRVLLAMAAVLVLVFAAVFAYRSIEESSRRAQIDSIVSSAAARRLPLDAQSGGTGSVVFVTVPGSDQAVLVAELPDLPADQQYQLWLIRDGQPHSAGVFSPAPAEQEARLLLPLPDAADSFLIGITVEPYGGSPAPTTTPIFLGTF